MSAPRWVLLVIVLLAVVAFAENAVVHEGRYHIDAHPQSAVPGELYWDDGNLSSGWVWYTGGNYWAVQFVDLMPGPLDFIREMGAVTYPGWPDGTYVGCYLHIFDDIGDYPGSSIGYEFLDITGTGEFEWTDSSDLNVPSETIYLAWEQIGDYPADLPDSIGVDASSGTHNWTGYQGSWGNTTLYGDFMLRCYYEQMSDTETTTWGGVKGLYQ